MNNLPIPQSRSEELMNAFIQRDSSQISTPQSRIEEFWYHLIEGTNSLPIPQSRNELLLKKIIENDTHQIPLAQSRTEEFLVSILTGDINKLPIPQSRSEYYLDYIARNNLLLNDIDYVRYSGTNITATNTVQKPFRSAILKGSTKYRDIDTGEILEAFEEGRNLELVSVKMPVLKATGKNLYPSNNSLDYNKSSKHYLLENYFESNSQYVTQATFELTTKNGKWTPIIGYEYTDGSISEQYMSLNEEIQVGDVVTNSFASQKGKSVSKIYIRNPWEVYGVFSNIQIEKGTTATPYEPYKSNILTVNEPIELRGIGDVQDTLDCLTGEVTERIGVVVLDGSESWEKRGNTNSFWTYKGLDNLHCVNSQNTINCLCAMMESKTFRYAFDSTAIPNSNVGVVGCSENKIAISFGSTNSKTLKQFKQELSLNPITVQYKLESPIVKTVDLKVVNQDGNQVKELSAFDGTTYIVSGSASDNSLIAITEVEVPTKLIEVLDGVKSLSSDVEILINEVDNTQKLQDENSTMAMSAMTELYEMILMMGGND